MRTVLVLTLLLSALTLRAGVIGKNVEYTADSVTMKGYLAYDDKVQGKRPAVLVVHEWWGHNDYARKRADMLAALGYLALAVDMYGNGQQADHPEDAGKFAAAVSGNLPVMKARFVAAMDLLRKNALVDPGQMAAIGYCFGGGVVLAMAREGADLKAVVSFHGSLGTSHRAEKGSIKSRVLACNGADDPFTTKETIAAFKSEMRAAGVDFKFVNYPGAVHSFTNPASTAMGKKFNIPLAYNEQADKKSWEEMKTWLRTSFKK